MSKQKPTFEEMMSELEQLVAGLENGKLSLEESLAAYEKASALSKTLGQMLDEGEKRVKVLFEGQEQSFEAEDLQ